MLSDRRNSKLCDSEIQENTHVSELGRREESIRLINDNLEHNNMTWEVITYRYSKVKIPCAELGYTELNSWVKGKGNRQEMKD